MVIIRCYGEKDSTYVEAHQHSAGAKKKGDWGREQENQQGDLPVKFMQQQMKTEK